MPGRKRETQQEIRETAKVLREVGAEAFNRGEDLDALSPLVVWYRRVNWEIGWKLAKRAARKKEIAANAKSC